MPAGARLNAPTWSCPSCGRAGEQQAAFCLRCGEARLPAARGGPFGGLARWRHSLWQLVRHPGQLTADWRDGRRRGQVAPLSLFLALNVFFFFAQPLTGLAVLSIPLEAHLHSQPYSALAQRLVDRRLAATGMARERFADRFELQQHTLAKASVIAMVPVTALAAGVLYLRRRAGWPLHGVFALHFHAYTLVFTTVFFALLGLMLRLVAAWKLTIDLEVFDNVVTTLEAAGLGAYLALAVGRVHGGAAWTRVAAAAALFLSLGAGLYLHRIGVFLLAAQLS